jgi:hypothetical protein
MNPEQLAVIVLSVCLIAVAALRLGDLKDRKALGARVEVLVARVEVLEVLVGAFGELARMLRDRPAAAPPPPPEAASTPPPATPEAFPVLADDVDDEAVTKAFARTTLASIAPPRRKEKVNA